MPTLFGINPASLLLDRSLGFYPIQPLAFEAIRFSPRPGAKPLNETGR
jgi:hypothetical protein